MKKITLVISVADNVVASISSAVLGEVSEFSHTLIGFEIADTLSTAPVMENVTCAPDTALTHETSGRIYSPNDTRVGQAVHWSGERFAFNGVVESLDVDNEDPQGKVVFVRRNDTGKLVSLTNEDLNRHCLTIR